MVKQIRHILRAEEAEPGLWVLRDTTTNEVVGGNCPDRALTEEAMYQDCDLMWGSGHPWYGKRVKGGYSIVVS